MADTASTGRTFTEGEAYALVADATARETAEANAKIESLEAAQADLQTKVDVLETEKAQAVQRAEAAEQALADYKAEIDAEKAREATREERTKALSTANPHLEITQERSDRIVAMSDDAFTAYLADMSEVASKVPAVEATGDALPSQSAAFQSTGGDEKTGPTLRGVWDAKRQLEQSALNTKGN
jgi:chromosome segregation ATPase